ncbi:MAG: metallophosphoesterase [Myxococcota bacterium]|nr:metallophosphoesterase [Myxococcota bacterium]
MKLSEPADSVLFVGDIQGCANELRALLQKANFNPDKHQLIPLGDTINRGPKSLSVLKTLQIAGAEPILGNHEYFLLKALSGEKSAAWLRDQTFIQELHRTKNPSRWVDWISTWPLSISGRGWLAVHAGVHPQLPPEKTPAKFLLTVRVCDKMGAYPKKWSGDLHSIPSGYRPWYHYQHTKTQNGKIFYGHWARKGLTVRKSTIGLDTGCLYGAQLSACWFPSGQLIQVPSQQPKQFT